MMYMIFCGKCWNIFRLLLAFRVIHLRGRFYPHCFPQRFLAVRPNGFRVLARPEAIFSTGGWKLFRPWKTFPERVGKPWKRPAENGGIRWEIHCRAGGLPAAVFPLSFPRVFGRVFHRFPPPPQGLFLCPLRSFSACRGDKEKGFYSVKRVTWNLKCNTYNLNSK